MSGKFPDIQFNIIGDGVDRRLLEKKAKKNVTFWGRLDSHTLASKFEIMDLLFLPSKSEGFPKVILEAAASGPAKHRPGRCRSFLSIFSRLGRYPRVRTFS